MKSPTLYLIDSQEEDIATNTASLSLLDGILVPEFLTLLDKALYIIAEELKCNENTELLEALETRLTFRKTFLEIVADMPMSAEQRQLAFKKCQTLLPKIVKTIDRGIPTPSAFSTRIQRKLSIQVPPRPMVSIDPKDAAKLMLKLLDDLVEIESIQEYTSPHEIIVLSIKTI
jgi:hypothetical protein